MSYQNCWIQEMIIKQNKAKRLIDDIRIDINKARVSKDDKNIFYGLNRLITDISNNRVNKENALEILKNRMSDLRWVREKQKTVFQNKIIEVI